MAIFLDAPNEPSTFISTIIPTIISTVIAMWIGRAGINFLNKKTKEGGDAVSLEYLEAKLEKLETEVSVISKEVQRLKTLDEAAARKRNS